FHQYLFFTPLGIRYWQSNEMTTMNETVANMAGREIGTEAYVLLTGQPPAAPSATPALPKPVFDFQEAMKQTRFHVEELLSAGEVDQAEQYMNERRDFLASHGYSIRKLNQAYFAFHGAYADSAASL